VWINGQNADVQVIKAAQGDAALLQASIASNIA